MATIIPRALLSWSGLDRPRDQSDPMVFISGARQVGKTFLARTLDAAYVNWDTKETKVASLRDPYFFRGGKPLVVFDEIHKRRDWKKLLKGYYDSPTREENFVVTGSGRFDQYRRGGDSLQGRYESFQLWPLAVDELAGQGQPASPRNWSSWRPHERAIDDADLIQYGGFPAPFLAGSARRSRRWHDLYLDRLIGEDARDFSQVQRIDQLELLARLLPERVASPLSVASLARDVEVSHVAINSWLRLFEILFFGFRLRPFHRKIHRAVKQEPKWFFYSWAFVPEVGPRFENYIAVQLALACSAWREQGYGRWELFYLRDQDRREVDFLLARDLQPQVLIEAKTAFELPGAALRHYTTALRIPGMVVYPQGPTRRTDCGWCVPSARLLRGLILEA